MSERETSNNMDMYSREKTIVVSCLKLIQEFSWLLNAFVLDFYTEDHWKRLPSSWRAALKGCSLEEFGEWMLMNQCPNQRVWPLSLLALRASTKALSLSRDQISLNIRDEDESDPPSLNNNSSTTIPGMETKCLTNKNLKQLFVKHVKPKKRHETIIMAKLCADAAIKSKVSYIVDVGGGKGHLSRLLAYGFGLRVCCVDSQGSLISSAREIDKQLEYTAAKHLGNSYMQQLSGPEYLTLTVGCSDDSLHLFKKEVLHKLHLDKESEVSFGIVGLHPCGDLAATLLRLFTSLNEAKFICIASCCYMKLSLTSCPVQGYPLSSFLQMLPNDLTNLTYEALELSCHALESYCQRLQSQEYKFLKIHSFRAALEKLIVKHYPTMKHCGLRSVKHFDQMDFPLYAEKALSRINLSIPLCDLTSSDISEQLENWQDVVAMYSLRLLLAPLVETVVLLDRLIYIQECGGLGSIIPGFDPVLSPRNLILQGLKTV
ncbi:methyltransferase-like protein 25B [Frankliniella occidentalis]|uniref:Methyltransferase-like protein 25B n=1 Tax=Frankliniella occidentalis TaxID=133901 RepID=A0A6J1SRC9_FRAOC|nr:methyltransferase-like protein 25B [Frankliniella occidentalis]